MKDKFDKETEDLGWAKMQALLDEDMPKIGMIPPQYVDSDNPSKSIFQSRWLMIALLLLGFGGCGLWTYQFLNNKAPIEQIIVSNNSTGLESNPPISNAQKLHETKKNDNHKTPKKLNPIKEITHLTKRLNSTNNLSGKTKTTYSSDEKNNLFIQKADNQLVVKDGTSNSITDKMVDNTEKGVQPNLKNPSEENKNSYLTNGLNVQKSTILLIETNDNELINDKATERLTFSAFEGLGIHALTDHLSSNSMHTLPIIRGEKYFPKTNQKWHLGISSGFHTEGVKNFAGYQMGILANRDLNRAFSLSIGLNYRKNTVQSPIAPSFLADLSNKNVLSISTSATGFNLTKVGSIELKNMQYAEMPLLINRRVKNRLSVSAGIKMSYLLSKKWSAIDTSKSNTYVINYSNSTKTNGAFNANDPRGTQQLALSSMDFAVLGSIDYRILSELTVSVRYDHGLKNILSNSNTAIFNRYIGFNVHYYFK